MSEEQNRVATADSRLSELLEAAWAVVALYRPEVRPHQVERLCDAIEDFQTQDSATAEATKKNIREPADG